MLDAQTKQRVDTLRDILVGKIPDPKSQIEQVTIALIYKFMQDMDNEAVNLEERRRFLWKSMQSLVGIAYLAHN